MSVLENLTPNIFPEWRDGNPEDGSAARRVEEVVLVGEHGVVHRVHEVGRLLLQLEGGLQRKSDVATPNTQLMLITANDLVCGGEVHVARVVGVAADQVLGHAAVPEGVAQPPPLHEDEDRRDHHDDGDDRPCSGCDLSN